MNYFQRPFHILGFDILVTDELDPILLEINASPSLSLEALQETYFKSGVFTIKKSLVDKNVGIAILFYL